MPLYPYRCTQCGHRFEKIQSFSAEPEKVCPKCGGAVERVLTAPGLQFKGAGWYVNDYSSKSGGGSSGESNSSSSESSSSETKAPAKTEGAAPSSSTPAAPAAASGSSSSSSTS